MATSPNFSWPEPDNTDLVKNGALAIRTAVDAIDSSMADLKGGSTNQVLAKNSNTDMDFKWVADASGIPATILDAKGDLIAATAADTASRLAVGTDGQVLTADSTAATGIKWATASGSSSGPAFRAYRSTSDFSFTTSTWTKMPLNAESIDTDNCYDPTTNYRFTPNKSGYYQINASIWLKKDNTGNVLASVRKNGTAISTFSYLEGYTPLYNVIVSGSDVIYLNGSTDYLEIYANVSGTNPYLMSTTGEACYFSGVWIRS